MIRAMLLAALGAIALPTASDQTPADSAAASLAVLMADAPVAPRKARAEALERLDRLGVHAVTGPDNAAMMAWRRELQPRPSVWRGRLLGPGFRQGVLAPGQHMEFAQVFAGGLNATVAVRSAPAGSVTVSIISGGGNAICRDGARCGWQPRFTERFTVRLANDAVAPRRFVVVVD